MDKRYKDEEDTNTITIPKDNVQIAVESYIKQEKYEKDRKFITDHLEKHDDEILSLYEINDNFARSFYNNMSIINENIKDYSAFKQDINQKVYNHYTQIYHSLKSLELLKIQMEFVDLKNTMNQEVNVKLQELWIKTPIWKRLFKKQREKLFKDAVDNVMQSYNESILALQKKIKNAEDTEVDSNAK